MLSDKIKLGDTISLYLNDNLIAKGVLWINAPIPLGRFYKRVYNVELNHPSNDDDDIYEDAIVIKDEKNFDNLIVLTLEGNSHKLFYWSDLLNENQNFKYKIIEKNDCLKIIHKDIMLLEVNLHKRE